MAVAKLQPQLRLFLNPLFLALLSVAMLALPLPPGLTRVGRAVGRSVNKPHKVKSAIKYEVGGGGGG